MSEPKLIAYEIRQTDLMPITPAPIDREWMDKAPQRFPYRCLPLNIANQCGWVIGCPATFRAYWYEGPNPNDVELQFASGVKSPWVHAHFGVGVITFSLPYLFRTPENVNLWVKGPANWIKDAVQPLEGVVETDWSASTFTMNWKITRPYQWVEFSLGEPICMIVPIPRGLVETFAPIRTPLASDPKLQAQYEVWEKSRSSFLDGLRTQDPAAVKQGWQKDYFQGKSQTGERFEAHQTRLDVKEFERKDKA